MLSHMSAYCLFSTQLIVIYLILMIVPHARGTNL